ncbi:MAG: hypothetical protein ABIZ49_10530 [Opitutaceae bacterium]
MKNRHEGATAETPEQLIEHISRLMAEAEAMITGPLAEEAGSKLSNIKERLESAKESVTAAYTRARKNVVAGAKYTNEAIREHPYQSLGIALGVGVLLGVIIGRKSN